MGLSHLFSCSLWLFLVLFCSRDVVSKSNCEFEIDIKEANITLSCFVPTLSTNLTANDSGLSAMLSFSRPIYNCFDDKKQPYRFGHFENCWIVDRLVGPTEEVTRFCHWAVSPLQFSTISKEFDVVRMCKTGNEKSLSTFHLSEKSQIRHSFTSFYVKFAVNESSGDSYYFGTSSRYFAWRKSGKWLFSAHSRNVGGSEFSNLNCTDVQGKPAAPCSRLADNSSNYTQASVEFVYEDSRGNAQANQIAARNKKLVSGVHGAQFTLFNNLTIPLLGLGTGNVPHDTLPELLRAAKEANYGLIDSAAAYENEDIIGDWLDANKEYHPLVQTKVWPTELGYHRTIHSVMHSRVQLNVPVLDVVLLHWPKCYGEWEVDWMDCSSADPDEDGRLWLESWHALERLYAEGFILAIGLSNYDSVLLKEAVEVSIVPPMIVQNEFTLYRLDYRVVERCRSIGALYQGYGFFRQALKKGDSDIVKASMKELGWTDMNDVNGFLVQLIVNAKVGLIGRSSITEHLLANISNFKRAPLVNADIFSVFLSKLEQEIRDDDKDERDEL